MKDKLYKMMNWPEIEAIVYGDEGAPQTILGRHIVSNYTLYQTFLPDAKEVTLIIEGDKKKYPMEMVDEEGFFAVAILGKDISKKYSYKVLNKDDKELVVEDPYIFDTQIKKDDVTKWNKGIAYNAYEYMGSHEMEIDGVKGTMFRVWAPNAIRASVVGEFNNWNGKSHPMIFDDRTGIFGLFIPGLKKGDKYKYEISAKGDLMLLKADPYAYECEAVEDGASIISSFDKFLWNDDEFILRKRKFDRKKGVLSIFETDNDFFTCLEKKLDKEKIDELCKYVSDMGYTHVMINVHHTDNYFCLYEKVDESSLKLLINELHNKNIGVIFRWNPTSFSMNEAGLKCFDGTYLYGHMDERRRYNALFGMNFNYAREQVANLLLSNVTYFFEEFHIDGIHMDEISTILYMDYGKEDGEWLPNIYGGRENLDAIEFIKHVNSIVHKNYPNILTTTKETCLFADCTTDLKHDGLGFDYIWDNGFSEDYMSFVRNQDSSLHLLTDNMSYAYSENYINTISKEDVLAANDYEYDRVLEGASFFDYIAFEDKDKISVKRATLSYIYARPGKKLFFMGQDDINLTPELNKLYKEYPALHSLDRDPYGFEWVSAMDKGDKVIAFLRKDEYLNHSILCLCNFSLNEYKEYTFGMPYEGKYKPIFNSNEVRFGGKVKLASKAYETDDVEYDGYECSMTVKLPAMSVTYLAYTPYTEDELLKRAQKKADKIKKELEAEALRKKKELEAEGIRKAKELEAQALKKAKELSSLSKKK